MTKDPYGNVALIETCVCHTVHSIRRKEVKKELAAIEERKRKNVTIYVAVVGWHIQCQRTYALKTHGRVCDYNIETYLKHI